MDHNSDEYADPDCPGCGGGDKWPVGEQEWRCPICYSEYVLRSSVQAMVDAALATPPDTDTRVVSVADILTAAVDEYLLQHVMETDWHRSGRHVAVRGLMVRLGLYPLLDQAIEELLSRAAIIEGKDHE